VAFPPRVERKAPSQLGPLNVATLSTEQPVSMRPSRHN